MEPSLTQRIYAVVRCVPYGKVVSYGQVAMLAGSPRASRIVGYALHRNPEPNVIPCHRVVFKDGSLCAGYVFGGADVQRGLLLDEGVVFDQNGRVDMAQSRWIAEQA